MDAVKYLKTRARMCDGQCSDCPLSMCNNRYKHQCREFECKNPEEAVAFVEKWEKEHPQKTYKDDFLEKFPNVKLSHNGYPICSCRNLIYSGEGCPKPFPDCKACWNEPMEV